MKKYSLLILLTITVILVSCGGIENKESDIQAENKAASVPAVVGTATPESVTASAMAGEKQQAETEESVKNTPDQTAFATPEPNLSMAAKSLYSKHMAENEDENINAFSLVDIDQDGIPELIEGQIYYPDSENAQQQVSAVYGCINGKLKKLTKKDFWHEREMSYLPEQNAILLYDGGTSNSYTYYNFEKNRLKVKGRIGKLWYDSSSTIRKPNLNGKWISEKKYKKFFKDAVNFSLVENTKENRELYFQNKMTVHVAAGEKFTIPQFKMTEISTTYTSLTTDAVSVSEKGSVVCQKEGEGKVVIKMDFPGRTENYEINFQVVKNFNVDESYDLVEMKISKIHDFGKKFLLTGKARIPVNALPTKKEVKQLKKGKLYFRGKTYTVKKVFDEEAYLTTYYLYENPKKPYDYELAENTALMNYPNPAVYDKKGKPVYDSAGEISVWINQKSFTDMFMGSMEDYFYNLKSWKNKWIPMDVTKNCVTRIMTE